MFLLVLVDWVSALLIAITGVLLGFFFYTQIIGQVDITLDPTSKYLLIYQIIFATLIGLLFARRRQGVFDQLIYKNRYLMGAREEHDQDRLKSLHYQAHWEASMDVQGMAYALADTKKQLSKVATTPNAVVMIDESFKRLEAFLQHSQDTFYYVRDHLPLTVTTIYIDGLLQDIINFFKKFDKNIEISIQNNSKIGAIQCDSAKIKQLLVNGLNYVQNYHKNDSFVKLVVADTQLAYKLTSINTKDHTKQVQALALTITTENTVLRPKTFYMGNADKPQLKLPKTAKDLSQRDNERIVDAHYGYIETVKKPSGSITQIYVIPVNVKAIRAEVMDVTDASPKMAPFETTDSLLQEKKLVEILKKKTKIDITLVQRTIKLIKQCHGQQKRKSGEPFYMHPIAVTQILLDITKDQDAVIAALLHDTAEDTLLSLAQIQVQFGSTVAHIVGRLTKLDNQVKKIKLSNAENKLQILDHEDVRIVQVKLADRLHNIRTLHHHSLAKQKNIAKETLDFYVPLAKSFKLLAIAKELETCCSTIN